MPQTSSPTVWRRWLALELRRLRLDAGHSMQQVAKTLGCTSTKVSYMEGAERSTQEGDLHTLLDLYAVPEDRRETYLRASKDARKKGWWERYDERTLPSWHSLYIGLEQGAARLRAYEPQFVHGLLQTPDYAAEMLRRGPVPRADEQVARLVELRATRQEALTRDDDPLEYWAVLDEAALRRKVGDGETMRDQLLHVAELAERPNVTVQVLPFAAGAHGSAFGAFKILSFPWKVDPGVVYLEYRGGAIYLEQQHEIEAHSLTFQQLCALALTPDESTAMIRTVAGEWGT